MKPISTAVLAASIPIFAALGSAPAHALTVTTPFITGAGASSTTLLGLNPPQTGTPTTQLQFLGFNPTNFPGTTGYILKNVKYYLPGVVQGNFVSSNFNPGTTQMISPNAMFNLNSNEASNGSNAALATPINNVPPPIGVNPGMSTNLITPATKLFEWNIWNPMLPGASPGNSAAYFASNTITLPSYCSTVPTYSPGGGFVSTDGCAFAPNYSSAYVEYTYDVPAPLPLVGAGAAFGWTRRLRRRISQKA